jgi:hypothetical protein
MVLAAGRGARLRPLTDRLPKCMVPIGGKPLLEHTIEWLRGFGVTEVVINLSHLPGVIRDHLGDGERWGVRITYSLEAEPLGTAGELGELAAGTGARVVLGRRFAPRSLYRFGDPCACSGGRLFSWHYGAPTQRARAGPPSSGQVPRRAGFPPAQLPAHPRPQPRPGRSHESRRPSACQITRDDPQLARRRPPCSPARGVWLTGPSV